MDEQQIINELHDLEVWALGTAHRAAALRKKLQGKPTQKKGALSDAQKAKLIANRMKSQVIS